ncbi:MAG TPA: hypothetical protein V6D14_18320 [Coleofasciculaceae cyanobacterium]
MTSSVFGYSKLKQHDLERRQSDRSHFIVTKEFSRFMTRGLAKGTSLVNACKDARDR